MPHPLIFLLLIPLLILLSTAIFHLLPNRNPQSKWRPSLSLSRNVSRLRHLLRRRHNLPRAAFGLPPLPRKVSVRSTAFMALCGAALVSLGGGAGYLVLATPQSTYATATSTQTLGAGWEVGATRAAVALLAVSVLALPASAVLLGSLALFLRHADSTTDSGSADATFGSATTSTTTTPSSTGARLGNRFKCLIHRLVAGRDARGLTHSAILRSTTVSTFFTAAVAGACAAAPHSASVILLASGGVLVVGGVGVGVVGWKGRRKALGDRIEAAAKYGESVSSWSGRSWRGRRKIKAWAGGV